MIRIAGRNGQYDALILRSSGFHIHFHINEQRDELKLISHFYKHSFQRVLNLILNILDTRNVIYKITYKRKKHSLQQIRPEYYE